MATDENVRAERYRTIISALLEATTLESRIDQAVMAVLETHREYLDGRFFNILTGFSEEAAINKNWELADALKQILGIARGYRASLTLQKLPPSAEIIGYDPLVEALMNAKETAALQTFLQEHRAQLSDELVAILLFRAMQARQMGRTELIQPLVELADLVLIYLDNSASVLF
jgi:hypothetical protein